MKLKYDPSTAPVFLQQKYRDYNAAKAQITDDYNDRLRDYLPKKNINNLTREDKKTPEYKRFQKTKQAAIYRFTKRAKRDFALTALSEPTAVNVIFENVPLFDAARYTSGNFEGVAVNLIEDLTVDKRVTLTITTRTEGNEVTQVIDRVSDIADTLEKKYKEIRTFFDQKRKEYEKATGQKLQDNAANYDKLVTMTLKEVSLPQDERVFLFLDVFGAAIL